jgi:parallel beta-helix repeat protein
MTLTEARKILGLGPDEDPRPHLTEFKAVREKIADMVRTAPNEMLAERYQQGLVEFDKSLAAVREYLEALGLIPRVEDVAVHETGRAERGHAIFLEENLVANPVGLPVISQGIPEISEIEAAHETSSGKLFTIACIFLLLLTIIGFGGWAYFQYQRENELLEMQRIVFLERQGAIFIENRRWPEAAEAFSEIEGIKPDSDLVGIGRRSIEVGMAEEQNQFVGYWKGEAIASFETGRWADAESAARQVLDKYPDEKELLDMIAKIDTAKQVEKRQEAFDAVRKQIDDRKFNEAIRAAQNLIEENDGDAEAISLLKLAGEAKEKAEIDLGKAKVLLAQATGLDTGEYDEQAMDWLREAVSLAPDDINVLASYEKMANYTRTIRIPGDFKTVQEALVSARDRDRIVVSAGTWEGPLVVAAGVEIEGISGKTIIQCQASEGSVISFLPGVKGARVSGLTIQHLSFDASEERFSLALVRDAKVDFSDCRFVQGSGHGIAVTEGGHAKVLRCLFTENGWNGLAVMGSGSLLEAEENTLKDNFQNGIESWDGASVILRANECLGNSRNGIHIDIGAASATVLDNILSGNREFGIVISSAGSGSISGNTIEKNILGGIVVKSGSDKVKVSKNTIRSNEGPGLVLEKGLLLEPFVGNTITGNTGKELISDADLSR